MDIRSCPLPFVLGILLLSGCVSITGQSDSRKSCSSLTISNHSAWSAFSPEGSDPILWQVFCTEQADAQLTSSWSFSNGPIGPHNSTKESYSFGSGRSTCTNHSLQLFNVTFADSAGQYTVSAESSCGSQANQTFLLSVGGCPCGSDHTPVPYPRHISKYFAMSNTSRNISLEAAFMGCADEKYYSVMAEHSAEIICKNNISLNSKYKCDRSVSNECLFFQRIVIVDYSPEDSGDYCFSAVSVTGRNNSNCVYIEILPWPSVSVERLKGSYRRYWWACTVHNYSGALNITAFKENRVGTGSAISLELPHTDGARYAVSINVPIGIYQLFVNFSDYVNTSNTGFQPIWISPGSVNFNWIFVISFIVGLLCLVFIILFILLCCWCCRREPEDFNDSSLIDRSKLSGAILRTGIVIEGVVARSVNIPENCHFITPIENIHINDMSRLYYNPMHGIALCIPEGAVPQGMHLTVSIGVCLCTCGNFVFPEGLIPVSAIVWLCIRSNSQIAFQKPIEVTIPHFLECEDDEDAASLNMSFMKASHWEQADEKIQFFPAEGQADFTSLPNKGILHTTHFCYLCIAAPNLPKILERQLFCLTCAIPHTITSWSNIYFYITYLNDTCLRDMESKLTEDYSVMEPQRIFKFSGVSQGVPAITGECNCSSAGRPVQVTRTLQPAKITMDSVNFWKLHQEGVLQVMHERKLYPPYMKLSFGELPLTEQLVVTVSFDGIQESGEATKIEIIVPKSNGIKIDSQQSTSDTMSRPVASDIPRLNQLRVLKTKALKPPIRLLEALAPHWETLGDTVGFDDVGSTVQLIKRECEREGPVACCRRVFQEWLIGRGGYQPPTWENLIQLLEDIDQSRLARAVSDSLS